MATINHHYGRGKLLLTSEYAVLDGAKALAIPTRFGQRMTVKKNRGSDLIWESLDSNGESWFRSTISLFDFSPIKTTDEEISKRLKKVLKNAVRLNSEFLSKWNGFKVETQLEFPLDWGLGSSSTLIHLVAAWADVNPLMLAFRCSNGSGYDVACAGAEKALIYQIANDSVSYTQIDWTPKYSNNLYFVHLGQKQKSDEAIIYYSKKVKAKKTLAKALTEITDKIINATSLKQFDELITLHEETLAKALNYETVKDKLFSDYWGSMKSLGAWGGDFILASSTKSEQETRSYFEGKGYTTILPYSEMIVGVEEPVLVEA